MKELRFRAWNGGAMEYGGFAVHATGKTVVMALGLTGITEDSPVMQYTGLKDKSGKKIYEGDIIETPYELNFNEYSSYEGSQLGLFRGLVHYRPSRGFMQRKVIRQEHDGDDFEIWLKNNDLENIVQSRCEIIGNIYQDAHLIKEGKE